MVVQDNSWRESSGLTFTNWDWSWLLVLLMLWIVEPPSWNINRFLYTGASFTEITLCSIQRRPTSPLHDFYVYVSLKNMSVFLMHLGGTPIPALVKRPGPRCRTNKPCKALYDYSGDKREMDKADSCSVTKCNTIKTIKSHKWTCHCGTLSIRHQSGGPLWGASTYSSCCTTL